MVNIFKKYRITSKKSMPFLFTTLADFYKHLHVNIWKTRSVHFKNYKRINNISKQSFKDYHKTFKSSNLARHLAVMINDDEDLAQDDLSLTSPHSTVITSMNPQRIGFVGHLQTFSTTVRWKTSLILMYLSTNDSASPWPNPPSSSEQHVFFNIYR